MAWKSLFRSLRGHQQRSDRRLRRLSPLDSPRTRRMQLEPLEERRMLTTITMGGPSSLDNAGGFQTDAEEQEFSWYVYGDETMVSAQAIVKHDGGTIYDYTYVVPPPGFYLYSRFWWGSSFNFDSHGPGLYELFVTTNQPTGSDASAYDHVVVEDDDDSPPSISLGGSSGTENHNDLQLFTWDVTDPSGVGSVNVAITKTESSFDTQIHTASTATGSFNFDSYGPGTYSISVSAADADSDWDSPATSHPDDASEPANVTRTVVVTNADPLAEAGLRQIVDEGSIVSFDGTGSFDWDGDTLTYLWEFGDGSSATGDRPMHVYADDGVYQVVLTVDGDFEGTDSDEVIITVENLAPQILSVTNSGPVDAGSPIAVEVSATDVSADLPLTYEFDFDNDGQYEQQASSSSGAATISHSFMAEGVYPVGIRVSDDDGQATTRFTAVQVGSPSPVTPEVDFVASSTPVVSEDIGTVTIEAYLSEALPSHDVIVPLVVTGSMYDSSDYSFPGYLLFPAGNTESSLEFTVTDDTLNEAFETFAIEMAEPVNAALGASMSHFITIEDNDPPPKVSFTTMSQDVSEDIGLVEVSARLSEVSGRDVVVPLTFSGTATNPDDYIPPVASILIPQGSLIGSTNVAIRDDEVGETSERISIEAHSSHTAQLSTEPADPVVHTIIILQNDEPSVSFLSAGTKVNEADGDVIGTVRLSNPSAETIHVPLSLSTDSTANLVDFTLATTELVFAPGETEKDVVVSIVNDSVAATTLQPISMTRQYDTANPFDGLNVGERSTPALGDLDGDGDLDLVAGSVSNGFDYFENTGTATSPNFVLRTGSQNPLDGLVVDDSRPKHDDPFHMFTYPDAVNNYSTPGLGDWDGDGDLDLISGNDSGYYLTYFENTGNETLPRFERLDDSPLTRYSVGKDGGYSYDLDRFSVIWSPGISFGDVTGDGIDDILVGGYSGKTMYYSEPLGPYNRGLCLFLYDGVVDAYVLAILHELGQQPLYSRPTFGDVDGDGDLDIVAGSASGGLQFFENTGSVTEPQFIERFGSNNPLSKQIFGGYSAPALGDLDGDGDLDLVVGDAQGGFSYFETTLETTLGSSEEQVKETAILEILPSGGFQLGETTSFTVEIEDDDIPYVLLNPVASVWEDVGEITASATLTRPTDADVIAPVIFRDSEEILGDATIRIPAGAISGTAVFAISDDFASYMGPQHNYQEIHTLTMGMPSNALPGGSGVVSFNVKDNDPVIRFGSAGGNEGGEPSIFVQITGMTNKPIPVHLEVRPASATEGLDYVVTDSTSLNLTPKPNDDFISAGYIALPIALVDDDITEGTEWLSVSISTPENASGLYDSEFFYGYELDNILYKGVSIWDNDVQSIQLEFPDSDSRELTVGEDVGSVPVTIQLSHPYDEPKTIRVGLPEGTTSTARGGEDFSLSKQQFDFAAGDISKTFHINVENDKGRENTETLELVALVGTSLISETAVLSITDNDSIITVPTLRTPSPGTFAISPDTAPGSVGNVATSFPPLGPISGPVNILSPGSLAIYTGIDGFISGGVAFFDGNNNGVLDFIDLNGNGIQEANEATEPSSVTEADGSFGLVVPPVFDRNSNGTIDEYDGQVVLTAGIDSSTGMPLGLSLTAPGGFYSVTPVTTLVNQLVRCHGLSSDAAQSRVLDAFGILQTDLSTVNPIASHLNGDPIGTDLVAAGAMLQDTVVQIAQLVSSTDELLSFEFAADRAFQDTAAKLLEEGSSLNLTMESVIGSIVNGTLLRTATSLDSEIVSGAGSVIAAVSSEIDGLNVFDPEAYLRRVTQMQVAAQGAIADALAAVVAGEQSIQTAQADYTGEALQNVIAAAEAQDILPPVIVISDVRELETEEDAIFEFAVSLINESTLPVTVDFATADHSADQDDYEPASGTLTWEPGDNTGRTIQVVINGDASSESDEEFLVILSNASNAVIRRDIGVGTIINDDALTLYAPNDAEENHLELLLDNGMVQFVANGETVVKEYLSMATPITIIGAPDVGNELVISIVGENPVMDGGIVFQGSASHEDVLVIYDGFSETVEHLVTGPGNGGFLIDGTVLSYSDVETVSDLMTPTIIELGVVDFAQLSGLTPSEGDVWYQFTTTRIGELTVIASAASGSVNATLYDGFTSVAASTAVDGGARLDHTVQAGETYRLRVGGDSTDVGLTIANLVATTGTEIQVFGTDDVDAFEFAATGSYLVVINGVEYHFDDTLYETIVFTGSEGDDTATLTGGAGNEIARFFPDHGTFDGNGFQVTIEEVTTITANGGGGADEAYMYDSPGDDEFIARKGYGKLSGEGFVLETFDFMYNYGYATTRDGGNDVAYMEDAPERDKFKFDWPKAGQFFGKMYGGGVYYNRAKNFEKIEAVMVEGKNTVRLFDSEGNDTFYGQKEESRLVGDGFDVTVSGYNTLAAFASTGNDIAYLEDSDDDDTTRARPHKITLWGSDDADPTYEIMARRFDEYHFEGKHAGYDRAKLHDTALSDYAEASGDSASLYVNNGELDLLYDVAAFEWVKLYGTNNGSQNTVKKEDPLDFTLIYDDPAMWDELP